MFDIEKAYLDIESINAGKWMPLGADFPGVEILARGLSAPGAKALRDQLRRAAPKADRLSNGQLSDEADEEILRTVIARECVHGWRGFASGGKALPFSVKTLESLMREERARTIAAAIVGAIIDLEKTTVEAEEAVSGNSPAS